MFLSVTESASKQWQRTLQSADHFFLICCALANYSLSSSWLSCSQKMAKEEKAGTKWKRKDCGGVEQPVNPHVQPVVRPAHQRSKVGVGWAGPSESLICLQ